MKKYAERSEAKKKYRTIKRGPKKLNFGASKPGVRGGPGPLGSPPGSASGVCFNLWTVIPNFLLFTAPAQMTSKDGEKVQILKNFG